MINTYYYYRCRHYISNVPLVPIDRSSGHVRTGYIFFDFHSKTGSSDIWIFPKLFFSYWLSEKISSLDIINGVIELLYLKLSACYLLNSGAFFCHSSEKSNYHEHVPRALKRCQYKESINRLSIKYRFTKEAPTRIV